MSVPASVGGEGAAESCCASMPRRSQYEVTFRKAPAATRLTAHELRSQGFSVLQIAADLGFSDRAVHRWLKQPPPPPEPPAPDLSAGLCIQANPDLFHPLHGQSSKKAKALCECCPVLAECRDYAVSHLELTGIWGGTSHRERYALAKKRKRS